MILSGADVQRYIRLGGLLFDPPLQPEQFQQNGVDLVLQEVRQPVLAPGQFTLGSTREAVTMPLDLMAFVQLRSTWARCGLMLPPTVVDAGFEGTITLEIASFADMRLPVGERFAHLIFARLSSPTEPYAGRYQHQRGITEARHG